MPRPLAVASVIDKNKLASQNPWLVLLDIKVIDPNTNILVETLRVVRNDEGVVRNGQIYQAANFSFSFTESATEEPTFSIAVQDQTKYLINRLDAYAGGVGFEVVMTIVSAARINEKAELEETFKVTGVQHRNYVVSVQLGAEDMLSQRFPPDMQFTDRCRFRYKGPKCQYSGAMATCDFTKDGPNGCAAHGNTINFGGYPGLRGMNI